MILVSIQQEKKDIKLTFQNYDIFKSYKSSIMKGIKFKENILKLKLFESNIDPMIRFMHIININGVGWIEIDRSKLNQIEDIYCDECYKVDYTYIKKYECDEIAPFILCAFDIECNSYDGSFPQSTRDEIIQIGLTFSKFGEQNCYYKHILCYKETDQLDTDINVQWFNTEEEMLLEFSKVILKQNPDILTGYNIFGFDYEYLYTRCIHLGIESAFAQFSRIKDEKAKWTIPQALTSAALGVNNMKYYDCKGRVNIDLMKVIRRDYILTSYKLDNVASYFIKEQIINIINKENVCIIKTKSTFGLENGRYIVICYTDGVIETKYNDGQKFKINNIINDEIYINENINTDKLTKYKFFWCQAKDDISPKEIFKKFRETSTDRAIIAKYCLQDCILCNKLFEKLKIITNNISMARVCNVPLSYLFLRGQGVKIFSLVAQETLKMNYIIPVNEKKSMHYTDIKYENSSNFIKNSDEYEDEDENDGYEGAIVFEPEPNVYYTPIIVLDFASLYPSSMILRNTSHECLVKNNKVKDKTLIIHHTSYKNNDETITECQFIEGKQKGIIPNILINLLNARKIYKNKMENEKDPFKKSILNGLQNAYKVTANSVYGQTGSSVSPIYMKEIAASTTAIGREMLMFAKYFIENIFLQIVNLAITNKEEYDKYMNTLYKYYPYKIINNDNITLTINSIENQEIPDNKFIKKSIDYEESFDKVLNLDGLNVEEQYKLYERLEKYINHNKGICKNIYTEYKTLFKNENEIKELKQNKTFLKNLKLMIDDKGFNNKQELITKFYYVINEILDTYTINTKIIYGDSVTGDTPLLLLDEQWNTYIWTIDKLGKKWDIYFDKFQDVNITDYVWTELGWTKIKRIIKHKTNKKIYGILTNKGYVQVTEDHSLVNINGEKITPKECYIGMELLHSYPSYPEYVKRKGNKKFDYGTCKFNKQITAMAYYYDMKYHRWYDITIKKENDEYILTYCTENLCNTNKIISIEEIKYENEIDVYDLETENHHFQAGIGEIIVHNTDSVFYNPNIKNKETNKILENDVALKKSIQLGIWSSILINVLLPPPMNLQYEKTMYPFIIQGKKRYVGNLYEKNVNKYIQKSMGIELKRRDNAPIVKIILAGLLDQLLNHKNKEQAFMFVQNCLIKILNNEYPMDYFVITKTIKGDALTEEEREILKMQKDSKKITINNFINDEEELEYKNKNIQNLYADRTRLAHIVLADRIADRDIGNKPLSNDRIAYAYIETSSNIKLQGDKIETPEYIIENNLKIDRLHYINNQIMKPILKFLDLICSNGKELFEEYMRLEYNRRNKIVTIDELSTTDNINNIDKLIGSIYKKGKK